VNHFRELTKEGDLNSQFIFSLCLNTSCGIQEDKLSFLENLQELSHLNHSLSCYILFLFIKFEIIPEDYFENKMILLKKSADLECLPAMYNYGLCLYKGEGIQQNFEEAVFWFKRAAESGDIQAMYNYGASLFEGEGIQQKFEESVFWFQRSAELGYVKSILSYAECLLLGIGTEKNSRRAYFIFLSMAYYGFPEGYFWCGVCTFFRIGVKQDVNNGLNLFCYLQNKCWNSLYYHLGRLFSNNQLFSWRNVSNFVPSSSISLEFFQLFSDENYNIIINLRYFKIIFKPFLIRMNHNSIC
jgi:TPR repeat protein